MSRIVLITIVTLLADPALAAVVTATPATFVAALVAAKGGDTIKLAPGSYGDVFVRSKDARNYRPTVTIDAGVVDRAGDAAAVFRSLRFDNASGLRIRNISFAGPGNTGFRLVGGSDVTIDGLFARDTTRAAVAIQNATDIRLTRVEVLAMGSDGIALSGVQRVFLSDITCRDGRPTPGAHPDCIQFYSKLNQLPLADITIDRVRVTGDTQGVTRYGDLQPAVRIRVNDIRANTTMIAVALDHPSFKSCTDCAITNSTAKAFPGARHIVQIAPQTVNSRFSGKLSGNSANSARPAAQESPH